MNFDFLRENMSCNQTLFGIDSRVFEVNLRDVDSRVFEVNARFLK